MKLIYCVVLAYIITVCHGYPNSIIKSSTRHILRIIGGDPADIKDYPYQVLLMIDGEAKCGGSILTESFILTAAHCVYDVRASQLSIRAGSSYRSSGGQVVTVAALTYHDYFDSDTYDYDIAILKLSRPLTLGVGVAIVQLPATTDDIIAGEEASATGWGLTDSNGTTLPEQLRVVVLPQITTQTCKNYYGSYITDTMFCAGYKTGGKDTCLGDSGGPIVVDGYVIGITSWGSENCAESGKPGVFTKVSFFRDYIDKIVAAGVDKKS
ncbi:trypsin-1-like [Sitophilus oryzae]|uniref:Trypsin-1-like n=1 Tax=Sitophilus oryzae TaxID=7048 RepID=A0A6J2XII5_SITOR|nr:trypsin-1-like [Sitophilus oryzae]